MPEVWTLIARYRTVMMAAARAVRDHQLELLGRSALGGRKLNQLDTILSEDFQTGATLGGVRFINPFAADFRALRLSQLTATRKLPENRPETFLRFRSFLTYAAAMMGRLYEFADVLRHHGRKRHLAADIATGAPRRGHRAPLSAARRHHHRGPELPHGVRRTAKWI